MLFERHDYLQRGNKHAFSRLARSGYGFGVGLSKGVCLPELRVCGI